MYRTTQHHLKDKLTTAFLGFVLAAVVFCLYYVMINQPQATDHTDTSSFSSCAFVFDRLLYKHN